VQGAVDGSEAVGLVVSSISVVPQSRRCTMHCGHCTAHVAVSVSVRVRVCVRVRPHNPRETEARTLRAGAKDARHGAPTATVVAADVRAASAHLVGVHGGYALGAVIR
jgi:hypothetical protein